MQQRILPFNIHDLAREYLRKMEAELEFFSSKEYKRTVGDLQNFLADNKPTHTEVDGDLSSQTTFLEMTGIK